MPKVPSYATSTYFPPCIMLSEDHLCSHLLLSFSFSFSPHVSFSSAKTASTEIISEGAELCIELQSKPLGGTTGTMDARAGGAPGCLARHGWKLGSGEGKCSQLQV